MNLGGETNDAPPSLNGEHRKYSCELYTLNEWFYDFWEGTVECVLVQVGERPKRGFVRVSHGQILSIETEFGWEQISEAPCQQHDP